LTIYSRSYTKSENLAKIGAVDYKTIGLTRMTEQIRNSSRTYSPQVGFRQPGGLKMAQRA